MRKMAIGAAMVMALALAPASALAQDDTMTAMVPHPSHIHVGSCPTPGDVIAPLSDVTVAGTESQGTADHIHVDVGVSTVDLALADILASEHAIVVHESADAMGNYIVCGNIGGNAVGDSFVVGLGPVGDSGYSGVAWLTDNGDGTTGVTVAITHSGASAMDSMTDMSGDDMSGDDM